MNAEIIRNCFKYWFLSQLIFATMLHPQIKIKAVGDVMPGSVTPKNILPPDSGNVFVKSIANYLDDADVVFGNLEGSFIFEGLEPQKCKEESRKAGRCYEFGIPEYLAASLKKMGFTVFSLDNNHSEDYGIDGYEFTKRKLDSLKISFAEKRGNASLLIKDKKIAVAAFGYSENSFHISDTVAAKRIIEELKKEFDIIIVSFHGGAEGKKATHVYNGTEMFLGENRGNVYAFAHTVIDAGADMVIGHGPHVLRAIEVYKNKLIAYSLGNFLTYGNMNLSGISGINVILDAEIDLQTGDFLKGKLIPIKQVGNGIPVLDNFNEGYHLIKELTLNDISEPNLIFVEEERIYNSRIIPPPIRQIEYIK